MGPSLLWEAVDLEGACRHSPNPALTHCKFCGICQMSACLPGLQRITCKIKYSLINVSLVSTCCVPDTFGAEDTVMKNRKIQSTVWGFHSVQHHLVSKWIDDGGLSHKMWKRRRRVDSVVAGCLSVMGFHLYRKKPIVGRTRGNSHDRKGTNRKHALGRKPCYTEGSQHGTTMRSKMESGIRYRYWGRHFLSLLLPFYTLDSALI